MAPEQARGEAADQRADIFSFGAVLYEMLTGSRAFTGASPVEVLHAVIAVEPDASKLSSTHPAIRRIVTRCLEKRREERFTSAQDVAYALESASDALSGTGGDRVPTVSAHWKRRGLQALVAAALLGAGIALGYFLKPDRETHDAALTATALRAQIQGPPGDGGVAFSHLTGGRLQRSPTQSADRQRSGFATAGAASGARSRP